MAGEKSSRARSGQGGLVTERRANEAWPAALVHTDPYARIFSLNGNDDGVSVWYPPRDWDDAAAWIHAKAGSPLSVSIGEVALRLPSLFRKYCDGCDLDQHIGQKNKIVSETKRGFSDNSIKGRTLKRSREMLAQNIPARVIDEFRAQQAKLTARARPMFGEEHPRPFTHRTRAHPDQVRALTVLLFFYRAKYPQLRLQDIKATAQLLFDSGEIEPLAAHACAENGLLSWDTSKPTPYEILHDESADIAKFEAEEAELTAALKSFNMANRRPDDPKKKAAKALNYRKGSVGPHKKHGDNIARAGIYQILLWLMPNKKLGKRVKSYHGGKTIFHQVTEQFFLTADPARFSADEAMPRSAPSHPHGLIAHHRDLPGPDFYAEFLTEIEHREAR